MPTYRKTQNSNDGEYPVTYDFSVKGQSFTFIPKTNGQQMEPAIAQQMLIGRPSPLTE